MFGVISYADVHILKRDLDQILSDHSSLCKSQESMNEKALKMYDKLSSVILTILG